MDKTQTIKCRRCGGAGEREEWRNTGSTCFDCGGAGTEEVTVQEAAKVQVSLLSMELGVIGAWFDSIVESLIMNEDTGRLPAQVAVRLHDLDDSAAARTFLEHRWAQDLSRCYGRSSREASRESVRLVIAAGRVTTASETRGAWRNFTI